MAKQGGYGKKYEDAVAAGKSHAEAHAIATGETKPPAKKKKSVIGRLKEYVGIQLKAEKKRRQNLEVKRRVNENKLKAMGKKSTKELEQKYKTVKTNKSKEKDRITSGLESGLTKAEIEHVTRKK